MKSRNLGLAAAHVVGLTAFVFGTARAQDGEVPYTLAYQGVLASAGGEPIAASVPITFRLYPTAEGGIQAEWSLGEHEISLEVDLSNHRAEWQSVNMKTHEQEDRELNLDDVKEWIWLGDQIRLLAGVQP